MPVEPHSLSPPAPCVPRSSMAASLLTDAAQLLALRWTATLAPPISARLFRQLWQYRLHTWGYACDELSQPRINVRPPPEKALRAWQPTNRGKRRRFAGSIATDACRRLVQDSRKLFNGEQVFHGRTPKGAATRLRRGNPISRIDRNLHRSRLGCIQWLACTMLRSLCTTASNPTKRCTAMPSTKTARSTEGRCECCAVGTILAHLQRKNVPKIAQHCKAMHRISD